MSRRQPAAATRQKAQSSRQQNLRARAALPFAFCLLPSAFCFSDFHIANIFRAHSFHKLLRFVMNKMQVVCFDHQKEPITRRQSEVRSIENRMVWLRQFIQNEHSDRKSVV